MAEFTVTLKEVVYYTVTVEVDDKAEAGEVAKEAWCNSEDPTEDFGGSGQGVSVVSVSGS